MIENDTCNHAKKTQQTNKQYVYHCNINVIFFMLIFKFTLVHHFIDWRSKWRDHWKDLCELCSNDSLMYFILKAFVCSRVHLLHFYSIYPQGIFLIYTTLRLNLLMSFVFVSEIVSKLSSALWGETGSELFRL